MLDGVCPLARGDFGKGHDPGHLLLDLLAGHVGPAAQPPFQNPFFLQGLDSLAQGHPRHLELFRQLPFSWNPVPHLVDMVFKSRRS